MTDLTDLLSTIQLADRTYVDMYKRRGAGSLQWFLEKDVKTHPIHNNNDLKFFVCGQEGFAAIHDDISAATTSIDIVLWGFDPGMELLRTGSDWPRGTTYGDLLADKALSGVKVRLLLWYSDIVTAKLAENVPDFPWGWSPMPGMPSDLRVPKTGNTASRAERLHLRSKYCTQWWKTALSGAFPNLEIRLRRGHPLAIIQSVETYLPDSTKMLTEDGVVAAAGTHHQKPILIDYMSDAEVPVIQHKKQASTTCGYVMGLNSVTEYWDTERHGFNDGRREVSSNGSDGADSWHRKPYRDYAIRIQGEALHDLNANFTEGWDSADGMGPFKVNGAGVLSQNLPAHRKLIKPKDLPIPRGARCRVQIVRTQPEKQDATILKAYTLTSANAVNYIYIENQYFQLAEWPRLLKDIRRNYRKGMRAAGAKPDEITPLHLFVVMPQAERNEMVPNTYDTLNQLGQGEQMREYDKLVQGKRRGDANSGGGIVADSVAAASADPKGELTAAGIKPLVAMLMTYGGANEVKNIRISARDNKAQEAQAKKEAKENSSGKAQDVEAGNRSKYNIVPRAYREIYIHSKLMFIDDVYTTLGSANLNLRSMAGDSEINICTEEYAFTQAARKRVWGNLAGEDLDGKSGSRGDMAEAFKNWGQRMRANQDRRSAGLDPVNGSFIHPLEDPRGEPWARLA